MNSRIKDVRNSACLSQSEFGEKIGVSAAAVSRWEAGERSIPDTAIISICRDFGISETWLRTGEGEMRAAKSREQEMAEMVKRLMADRPDSFRSALITTLLRLDPDGKEWDVLEDIYKRIVEVKKDQEP